MKAQVGKNSKFASCEECPEFGMYTVGKTKADFKVMNKNRNWTGCRLSTEGGKPLKCPKGWRNYDLVP